MQTTFKMTYHTSIDLYTKRLKPSLEEKKMLVASILSLLADLYKKYNCYEPNNDTWVVTLSYTESMNWSKPNNDRWPQDVDLGIY